MNLRVLIVAEHASAQFGGEAILPLHYFRILRQRNIETWMIVHARTRPELEALFANDRNRIFYVPDTQLHRWLFKLGTYLPSSLSNITFGLLMRLLTQLMQRKIIRQVIATQQPTVIHQPIPVSPKEPSLLFGLNVPVVIGPMNGGMQFPPAFQSKKQVSKFIFDRARSAAHLFNHLLPGKRQAAILLVANDRTGQALPQGCDRVIKIAENGVDLSIWHPAEKITPSEITRFVFVGRLVDWKAVDLLLLAFQKAASQAPIHLEIIGTGAERANLEQQTQALGLSERVQFSGWLSQRDCAVRLQHSNALVLPSLSECGGAVVLEAMAVGLPVIATDWGGPADYLDATCGILVKPESRDAMIEGFAAAMVKLARSPEVRLAMGKAGQARVKQHFDWEAKVDRMLEIYQQAIAAQTVATHVQAVAMPAIQSEHNFSARK